MTNHSAKNKSEQGKRLMRALFIIVASFFVILICGCKRKQLILREKKILSNARIDTIESYANGNIYLLGVTENHAFGKFDYYYAMSTTSLFTDDSIVYEIEKTNYSGRIGKDFIALVAKGEIANWGWFNLENGKIKGLPHANRISDSLRLINNEYFLRETNGYFSFYQNGKVVKEMNYGDFVTKYENINFNELDYGLYKLIGDSLVAVSKDGNDLLKQKTGVFFVPLPGYDVKQLFEKSKIIHVVDSISKLQRNPRIIELEPYHFN